MRNFDHSNVETLKCPNICAFERSTTPSLDRNDNNMSRNLFAQGLTLRTRSASVPVHRTAPRGSWSDLGWPGTSQERSCHWRGFRRVSRRPRRDMHRRLQLSEPRLHRQSHLILQPEAGGSGSSVSCRTLKNLVSGWAFMDKAGSCGVPAGSVRSGSKQNPQESGPFKACAKDCDSTCFIWGGATPPQTPLKVGCCRSLRKPGWNS